MNAPPPPRPSDEALRRRRQYWRANLILILVLMALWAGVSLGASILFVEWLNQFSLGNVPLGFWMAQQGSIYTFVLIIGIYALGMDWLDRRFHRMEDGDA